MTDRSEVIVIFGAAVRADGTPSGALRRRVAAASNYGRGRAAIFLVSGGEGRYPPAEAAIMASLLRADGVPDAAIVQEDQSKTTLQSVVHCGAIIRGLGGITRVMACSDAYHLPRCLWLFRLSGIVAGGIAAADGRHANTWQKWLWFHLREFPAIAVDTVLVLARRVTAGGTGRQDRNSLR